MKKIFCVGLAGALWVSAMSSAWAVTDDFNDNVKGSAWGDDLLVGDGTNAALNEINGHLEFTGSSSFAEAVIVRPWGSGLGSYTQNWEVAADVHVGALTMPQNAEIEMFLAAIKSGDISNRVVVSLVSEPDRGVNLSSAVDDVELTRPPNYAYISTADQQVRLCIAFDSSTKMLTASCNARPLGLLDVDNPSTDWAMDSGSSFMFVLGGSMWGNNTNSGHEVYADNFELRVGDDLEYLLVVNSGTGSSNYPHNTSVSITASNAPDGWLFNHWAGSTQYVASVTSSTTTVTMPAQAITLTATYKINGESNGDDFNDNILDTQKWGDAFPMDGMSTDVFLTETNTHLEFTGSAEVMRPWIAGCGSYTQSWEVAMEAHVALSEDDTYVNINLGVFNLQDTHWLTPVVKGDVLTIALELYRAGDDTQWCGYELTSYVNANELTNAPNYGYVSTADQQGQLKITFDAATKMLTASYNGNVLGWVDVDAPGSNWQMTDVGTFAFGIGGGAWAVSISPGEASADNFTTIGTVVPEFAGMHFPYTEFDDNVSDGVTIEQQPDPFGFSVSQNDSTNYTVSFEADFSFAAQRVGNRIQSVPRSIVMDSWNMLDFIMLSDGTNRVFAEVGQEHYNPLDVSFLVGSWSSYTGSVTVADFVGTWNLEVYSDTDLRNAADGFDEYQSGSSEIRRVDADHIYLTIGSAPLLLRVSGNEAFLESPPVVWESGSHHTFRLRTDGKNMSLYFVTSETNNATDVSVTIGLGVKQAPATNSTAWQSGPWLLTARDSFAGGVLNDKLIVFGGNGNPTGGNLKSTELFDPAADSWIYKADNNHNGDWGVEEVSGATVNGKFYIFGAWGGPDGVFNFVEEYNPSNDTWTSKAPMPTTRASATAVAYNNKIYVFGGYYDNDDGSAYTNYTVVEVYDPASNTWATETYMPKYVHGPAIAVVSNKVYVMSGVYGDFPDIHFVNDVSVYDFTTHTWSTNSCAPLPLPAWFGYSGAASVKDGKIYLIGEFPTGDITSNSWATCFFIYDTAANTWAIGDPLPGGQVEYGFKAIIGNDLWVVGGDIAYSINEDGDDLVSGAVWKHSLTNIILSQYGAPDSDADGILDSWEQQYFGGATNAHPNAICSNGFNTVIQAYVAGLNPNDPNAWFGITSLARNLVQWNAVSGRVYSVYWTSNLLNQFQPLTNNYTGGSFTDVLHNAEPKGFYKIKVQLPQ